MMIACPTCDSRYDADAYAPGQRLRCHCGNVFAYEPPKAQAGTLACPHCGGAVSHDDTRCKYCAIELLEKACPRCMSRVFAGYKHCPHCGAELGIAAAPDPKADMPCPRCSHVLQARLVGDIVIDECAHCNGVFIDTVAVERVINDANRRAPALLAALPTADVHVVPKPGEKFYVKCPMCHELMNRRQFASGAQIVVDVCKNHGTFFDVGELPAILQWATHGGVAIAPIRTDAEWEKLRAEQEQMLASPHYTVAPRVGPAIVDLLKQLFRD
jgi:Zn-finger nucleic acid-binding protein